MSVGVPFFLLFAFFFFFFFLYEFEYRKRERVREREREREREGENTADYDGLNFFVVRFVPASRITNSGV